MKKNSLNGKIKEFDKNEKIRKKSGNFTIAVKKNLTNGGFLSFKILNLMRINFWQNSKTF